MIFENIKKKSILFILIIFSGLSTLFAQEYKELYTKISTFKEPYEYDEIDCEIIEITDYLLSLCYDEDRYKEDYAYKSMINWMDKTDIYHIITGGKIKENCPKRSVLANINRMTLTKYLFQNDSLVQYAGPVRYVNLNRLRETIYGGAEIFMEYLKNQEKVTLKKEFSKELNKGLKLYNDGNFQEFMKN